MKTFAPGALGEMTTAMKQKMNLVWVLSLTFATAAIYTSCAPVTPSQGKYQATPAGPGLPGLPNVLVVTVSKLDVDAAKEKELAPDTVKIVLSEDDSKQLFEEFKETGKLAIQLEGTLPAEVGYTEAFEHSSNKKDLADQAQFKIETKFSSDQKNWVVSLEDKSADADAGKRARQHLAKITLFLSGDIKVLYPEPTPSPEPATMPSPVPSPEPSILPSPEPSVAPSAKP